MSKSNKICPISGEACDPFDWTGKDSVNLNCSFYVYSEHAPGYCIYIEAMKALPKIADNIGKIKL